MAMEIHVSIVDNSKGSILLAVPLTIRVHVARLYTSPTPGMNSSRGCLYREASEFK